MIDPNSWLYSAFQGLEQVKRAISQLSPDEITQVEVDLDICQNVLRERKAKLGL
jgi:hypothetical protein